MIIDGINNREIAIAEIETQIQKPQKASWLTIPIRHKFISLLLLVSLISFMAPHETMASQVPEGKVSSATLVFALGHKISYLDPLNAMQLNRLYERKQMQAELDRQIELNNKVKSYLKSQGSPLAAYTSTLLQLPNWKKIIALSNAESGMCKHYPVAKANCWGIGGANLWYMGSNLGEGIVSMNHFLNTYPANSKVKYTQMTFKQMNGLYKQPAAQHWVDNNQAVYDDLTAIENSL
jgi:hypothetical protein